MNRSWAPWLLVLLSAVWVAASRATASGLLEDSDTRVLLSAIAERNAPLSWFGGDWPLQNHFYRPISTLFFEFDSRVWGGQAWGFGLTNALVCAACVLLLAWVVQEYLRSVWAGCGASVLFAVWHLDLGGWLALPGALGAVAVGVFVGVRQKSWSFGLLCGGLMGFLLMELAGKQALYFRMVAWLPGRTASTMALFGLLALGCLGRGWRSGSWTWCAAGLGSMALAMGCYEQAVMLPGIATVLWFVWPTRRPAWQPVAASWLLLGGYLALRAALVPSQVSGYQAQQFRDGPGVFLSLTDYVLPIAGYWPTLRALPGFVPELLFLPAFYGLLYAAWTNLAAVTITAQSKAWMRLTAWWLASCLAFLPMAWLKPFEHYHYFPMALRSVFVVLLAGELWRLLSATSRPASPTPSPPDP